MTWPGALGLLLAFLFVPAFVTVILVRSGTERLSPDAASALTLATVLGVLMVAVGELAVAVTTLLTDSPSEASDASVSMALATVVLTLVTLVLWRTVAPASAPSPTHPAPNS